MWYPIAKSVTIVRSRTNISKFECRIASVKSSSSSHQRQCHAPSSSQPPSCLACPRPHPQASPQCLQPCLSPSRSVCVSSSPPLTSVQSWWLLALRRDRQLCEAWRCWPWQLYASLVQQRSQFAAQGAACCCRCWRVLKLAC